MMQWTTAEKEIPNLAEKFSEEGYVLLGRVLTDASLAEARTQMDRMIAKLHPSMKPDEFYSAHQQERWLLELCNSSPLLDALEAVIGPDIVLWSTHLICKRPQTGRAIPWHQDGAYWNLNGRFASIWMTLDNLDDANGTMYVLPGYHGKTMPRRSTGDDFFDEEIEPDALPADLAQREVGYFFEAGAAAIHDERIPHRSPPNRTTDRWRRVLVLRYLSADSDMGPKQYADYRTNEPFDRRYYLMRGHDHGQELVEDVATALATMEE